MNRYIYIIDTRKINEKPVLKLQLFQELKRPTLVLSNCYFGYTQKIQQKGKPLAIRILNQLHLATFFR